MVIKSAFVTIRRELAKCCLDVNLCELPMYRLGSVGSLIKRIRHDHLKILESRETNCNSGDKL